MTEKRQPKRITRRTVVKGAAWAIPAVPLVVAAPAYAASPDCLGVTFADCQEHDGIWQYHVRLCNTCSPGNVVVTDLRKSTAAGPYLYTNQGLTTVYDPNITLVPGQCVTTVTLYSSTEVTLVVASYTRGGNQFTAASTNQPVCGGGDD